MSFIVNDIGIAIYANDSTIHKEYENIDNLILSLQDAAASIFKRFFDNQMKDSKDKCHLLMNKDESWEIHIGESIIKTSDCEKLRGIKIDSKCPDLLKRSSSISI